VRVAGVDDDVAGFQQRFKLLDDGVHRLAGLDHDQDAAGLLQGVDQLLQRFGADEVAVRAVLFEQCVGLFHGPVVQGNRKAVAGQVAGQVGSHHRKAGDTDVCRHQKLQFIVCNGRAEGSAFAAKHTLTNRWIRLKHIYSRR
jgi:hypothetical protein